MGKYNMVTIALICLFILPIAAGCFRAFTKERIQRSFSTLVDNIEFIAGLFFAIFLTSKIFFENQRSFFKSLYELIPQNLRDILYGKDVLTYIIVTPILLLVMLFLLRLATNPIYGRVITPLSQIIYSGLNSMSGGIRRFLGALVQLPRAFFIVFVLALVLNFYTYYFYSPILAKWMNDSAPYQLLYKYTIYPVLNSNIAKQIPVIVNNSFGKKGREPGRGGTGGSIPGRILDELTGGKIRVKEYFNGVTLDEAIRSNAEIDSTARKIVGKKSESKEKAYLLYRWISKNIKYDYKKAERISSNPKGISSGAIVAFETGKGICFDYSSLYVAMCRVAGLKVRMVTGLGYSGVLWGDHAWNQVYCTEEKRWINVDTTFGAAANYFDKKDFSVDHEDAEIQGEW